MKHGQTVIVIDVANYKASYAEQTPFKGTIVQIDEEEHTYFVESEVTGKEYELYFNQILETLDIEEIDTLIDMSKYGS